MKRIKHGYLPPRYYGKIALLFMFLSAIIVGSQLYLLKIDLNSLHQSLMQEYNTELRLYKMLEANWNSKFVPQETEEVSRTSFQAITTAYSELDSCHYPGCPMANGERAHVGAVACPRGVNLGTRVIIDGREYVCKDRTAKRYDGRYDIFIGFGKEAYQQALNYGKRDSTIILVSK